MHNFDNVLDLTQHAADLISNDELLSSLSVKGELSGVRIYTKRNRYGSTFHTIYFTLKDQTATVDGIMFLSNLDQLGFEIADGQEVICYGSCSLYEPKGQFRIKASTMRLQGMGDLQEQMRRLYERLNAEGLFAPEHKQTIPLLPKRIGVITSQVGDVIHDIITTLNEHNDHYDILVYPAAVSGADCPGQIIEGLRYLATRNDIDVIVIARGGGAPEEFIGFNTESLARAIYDCPIPVISAVGHEPDYTICDYAADLRVPTPTAAGNFVMGGYNELTNNLINKRDLLDISMSSYVERKRSQLDSLRNSKALYSPTYYVTNQRSNLRKLVSQLTYNGSSYVAQQKSTINDYKSKLDNIMNMNLEREKFRIKGFIDNLDMLGPINVLKRGYSYVTAGSESVSSVDSLSVGSSVNIVFADGSVDANITAINKEEI